ncbi:MAG: 30S ribosome-binding factor RbfA [Dehalococcoidia bacterium]|jgi:ribosome-binding factor A
MSSRRVARLNDAFREEISDLLRRQVKDPRLTGFITITRVETSGDLSHARVFFSVMGSEEARDEALRGLVAAASFLRREIGHRLSLRRAPELSFHRDDSIEQGARVLDLLDKVAGQEPEQEKPSS